MNTASQQDRLTAPLAEKFVLALAKKKPASSIDEALPDLDSIQVTVASTDEVAKQAQAARERSAYARKAAEKIMEIRRRLAQIETIKSAGGVLASCDIAEAERLRGEEAKILSAGDGELQKSLKFALFLEEIRSAEASATNARAFLARVCSENRFHEATTDEVRAVRDAGGKFPSGTLFYGGKTYLPDLHGGSQSALEAELRKFITAVKAAENKHGQDLFNSILRDGNADLGLLRRGVPGMYALHLPERKDGKKTFRAGAALVAVASKPLGKGDKMTIIKVVRGAGQLAWLNEHEKQWISLTSFLRETSDKNLEGTLLEFSERFIRTLKAACVAARRRTV